MKVPLLIIGGGLSGLAAAIRCARFSPDVLLIEKHNRIGGLNSYYYRNKILLETGLHAITNYAPAHQKKAPLNRLLRQLKLSRKDFQLYPQYHSEVVFNGCGSLNFSNDFQILSEEIESKFPTSFDGFIRLVKELDTTDPFRPGPFRSAKEYVNSKVSDALLTDMLLCPLMYYGSSVENDIDFNQFIIMFRSIFQEGMFRPAGTIKDLLDTLKNHYVSLGGEMRLNCKVTEILTEGKNAIGVKLASGEVIECDQILSTIGHRETLSLLPDAELQPEKVRLGFVETIFLLNRKDDLLPRKKTIIFYNEQSTFTYARPNDLVDYGSGVICLPNNFDGRPEQEHIELRSTHLANYHEWKKIGENNETYAYAKEKTAFSSSCILEKYIGNFRQHITFQDTFTPLTIKRYTDKREGAIYGSPHKIKDGKIGYSNLYLGGTDQGFLGIIGSMLSGVSMVNQHILPRL